MPCQRQQATLSPAPVKHKGYATASVEVKGQCKIYESQVINNGNAIYNATRVAIVDDVCYSCCACCCSCVVEVVVVIAVVLVVGRHCQLTRRTINMAQRTPLSPSLSFPLPLSLPLFAPVACHNIDRTRKVAALGRGRHSNIRCTSFSLSLCLSL